MTKPGILKRLTQIFQASPTAEETAVTAATESPSSQPDNQDVVALEEAPAPTVAATAISQPPETSNVPHQTPAPPLAPMPPQPTLQSQEPPPEPEPEPVLVVEPTLEQITSNDGPVCKVVSRGGRIYAVCPKCEAMWNLKDRLTVILQKRLDKSLTCAACEQTVSLPPDLNLRKL